MSRPIVKSLACSTKCGNLGNVLHDNEHSVVIIEPSLSFYGKLTGLVGILVFRGAQEGGCGSCNYSGNAATGYCWCNWLH